MDWETVTATQLGWNTENEEDLREFLNEKNTKAFIITKGGRIVVEWYFDEHTQNTSWYWASAGKTLTAFTVGISQELREGSTHHAGQLQSSQTGRSGYPDRRPV